jgi:hypothetical protein
MTFINSHLDYKIFKIYVLEKIVYSSLPHFFSFWAQLLRYNIKPHNNASIKLQRAVGLKHRLRNNIKAIRYILGI